MKNIIDIIEFLNKEKIKFQEDFQGINFTILKECKTVLKNKQFWTCFNNEISIPRFLLQIDIKYKNKTIPINIDEGISTDTSEFDKISDEFSRIAEILAVSQTNITDKEITALIKAFNNILTDSEYKLEKCDLYIKKDAIGDYLAKIHSTNTDIYNLVFWSSLEQFTQWIEEKELKTISYFLAQQEKMAFIVIPGVSKKAIFSNFFSVYTLDKLVDLKTNNEFLKEQYLRFKDQLQSISIETELIDNTPIFPYILPISINKENEQIWHSLAKTVLFYLFTIFSKKVTLSKSENQFNFLFGHDIQQSIEIIDINTTNVEITIFNKSKITIDFAKKTVIDKFNELVQANFLENIGRKESILIRQSIILGMLAPPAEDLTTIIKNTDDLLKRFKSYRDELFGLKLKEINSIISQLESSAKKRSEEVSTATAKMTIELSKAVLSILGSTALTIFAWYMKLIDKDFTIKSWIIRGIFPLIAGFFIIFFLMQIISIRRGVFTQKDIFEKVTKSVKDITKFPIKDDLRSNFDKNLRMFKFYFWFFVIISIALFLINMILFPIYIKIPIA